MLGPKRLVAPSLVAKGYQTLASLHAGGCVPRGRVCFLHNNIIIVTCATLQLVLALADLALQMEGWETVVEDVIARSALHIVPSNNYIIILIYYMPSNIYTTCLVFLILIMGLCYIFLVSKGNPVFICGCFFTL